MHLQPSRWQHCLDVLLLTICGFDLLQTSKYNRGDIKAQEWGGVWMPELRHCQICFAHAQYGRPSWTEKYGKAVWTNHNRLRPDLRKNTHKLYQQSLKLQIQTFTKTKRRNYPFYVMFQFLHCVPILLFTVSPHNSFISHS